MAADGVRNCEKLYASAIMRHMTGIEHDVVAVVAWMDECSIMIHFDGF